MPGEADPIKKFGGRYGYEIDKADQELRNDIRDNTRRIADIEKALFANGRPSLEDRLKDLIESRVNHKERNAQESDGLLANEIKENRKHSDQRADEIEEKQDRRHEENQKRFNSLENKMAMAAGAIIVLQPLFALLLQHVFGGGSK